MNFKNGQGEFIAIMSGLGAGKETFLTMTGALTQPQKEVTDMY
jgi:ABC-type lipoprotein export system ATPase subunit